MKLSEKILSLRKQHGLSQEDMAEKLNVSRQAVSRWENGTAQPDASNVFQLSRLFGVTADYLLNDGCESCHDVSAAKREGRGKTGKTKKVVGLCISAAGLLGNFLIYILSRTVEVVVPFVKYGENGEKWYHWSNDHTGYSYKYFILERELEFLTVMLWALVIAGLIVAFANKDKLRAAARLPKKKAGADK